MASRATFRGVPFAIKSEEQTLGRRKTLHAVPFQDTGARANDVGRSPRKFSFTAVFLHREKDPNRQGLIDKRGTLDEFRDAIEAPGPGLLIHPTYGRVLCHVDDRVTFRDATNMLGKTEVSFSLTEAADQQAQRKTKLAPLGAVKKYRGQGVVIAEAQFTERIGYPALSDFLQASRITAMENVLSDLRGVNAAIGTALSVPSGFASQIDSIGSNLALLMATPRRAFQAVTAVMDEIAQAIRLVMGPAGLEGNANVTADYFGYTSRTSEGVGSLGVAGRAAALMGSDTPEVPVSEVPERQKQREETNTILTTMRASMLLALADSVADMPLDSTRDVAAVRTGLIENMLLVSDSDNTDLEISNVLRDAAAALTAHLRDLEATLTTHTVGHPLPAEVLAHMLYGDPERADEIVARNKPSNPGALSPFTVIEIRKPGADTNA